MFYNPLYPGWYFSYVNIPNFEDIRLELVNLISTGIRSYQTNSQYYNVLKKDINNCPKFFEYLNDTKLINKFNRILFSTNIPRQPVAHVDGYNEKTKNHFSLNLPLIDCENSYTVFYEFNGKHLYFNPETYDYYAWMSFDKVKEISKVECNKPVLVNTTILHCGSTDKSSRTIAGIRFKEPLSMEDMKQLGIKNPLMQEDN
jgi:hypothetical protein